MWNISCCMKGQGSNSSSSSRKKENYFSFSFPSTIADITSFLPLISEEWVNYAGRTSFKIYSLFAENMKVKKCILITQGALWRHISYLSSSFSSSSSRQTQKFQMALIVSYFFYIFGYHFFVKFVNGCLMPLCPFFTSHRSVGYAYGCLIEIGTHLKSLWYILSIKKNY